MAAQKAFNRPCYILNLFIQAHDNCAQKGEFSFETDRTTVYPNMNIVDYSNKKQNSSESSISLPAKLGMTDQSVLETTHPNPIGLVQLKTLYKSKEVTI